MARKLSPLTAAVILDINSWTAGLKKMERDRNALVSSLKPISKALGDFGKPLLIAGTAISAGLLAMAKSAANFGDEMKDARQRTGLAAEQLSAYKLVADQSGTSFEALTGGLAKLSKTMFEAATKGGESAKIFNALGIELKDASGQLKNAGDILPQIADKLSKLEDGTTKTALAQKLFGKSAADLIPFLNEGSAGMAKAEAATRKFGTALSDAQIELGDKFNDSLEETKVAMQGLAVSVGNVLLPPLTKLIQAGNEWIATAGKMARENPGLTKGLAAAGLALVGAGGFLLGLQQLIKIAPTAILVLNDIRKGMAAIALLKGVSTFADFSAGISLIGQSSIAAKAGLIGLAAAAGFAIGSLANYLIELAGIQKEADVVINSLARIASFGLIGTSGVTYQGDTKSAQMAAAGLEAEAKRRGLTVEQLRAESSKLGMATRAAAKPPAIASGIKDYEKLLEAFEKTGKATKDAADKIEEWDEELRQGFDDAVKFSNSLQDFSSHQVKASIIVAKYGDEIKRAADEFRLWGLDVPPMLAKFADIVEAQERLKKVTEETTEKFEQERVRLKALLDITEEVTIKRDAGTQAIIDATAKQGAFDLRVKDATDNLKHQREEVADLSQQILALNRQGLTAKEIEQALGVSLTDVARRAKELGVQIDPLIRKMGGMVDATDNLKRSWSQTLGGMTDQLVDFVVEGEYSWKRLADIGKNTFKDLGRSFLDGLVKPLKQGLEDLGEHAAQALGNILFGGNGGGSQQQGSGGILGGIIGGQNGGGILGGIFGGGGGSGGGTPPFVQNGMSSGMKFDPFSAANSLFDLGSKITGKIGAGRDSANEIVKSQNAFEGTIGGILNDSGLSASNKLKQVNNVWQDMQANLARFSAAGGEGGTTANQAFATLSPFIAKVQSDLIKSGASDGTGGDGASYQMTVNVNITGPQSAESIVDLIRRNVSGITEEMVRQVELRGGAVVSR